jgi:butyrate kinase
VKILVINPGSTSTKVALFEDTERIVEKKIDHSREELSAFSSIKAELPMRISRVKDFLHEHETSPGELDVIVSRGTSYSIHETDQSFQASQRFRRLLARR